MPSSSLFLVILASSSGEREGIRVLLPDPANCFPYSPSLILYAHRPQSREKSHLRETTRRLEQRTTYEGRRRRGCPFSASLDRNIFVRIRCCTLGGRGRDFSVSIWDSSRASQAFLNVGSSLLPACLCNFRLCRRRIFLLPFHCLSDCLFACLFVVPAFGFGGRSKEAGTGFGFADKGDGYVSSSRSPSFLPSSSSSRRRRDKTFCCNERTGSFLAKKVFR